MNYEYLGTARNVRELTELLAKVDQSATLTVKSSYEDFDSVEILVSEYGDDIMIR